MVDIENVFAAVTDLETTGLSAALDVPLEIGVKLIDKEGFVFSEFQHLVWEEIDVFQQGVARGERNSFVNEMHTKSGLWDDLHNIEHRMLPNYSRDAVDNQLADWLSEQIGEDNFGKVPMLGNSIGSLDRPFALIHFPMFNGALSYRNIDISTVKELCKAHNPILFENLRPIIGDKSNATHRVMGDIDACLVEYRAYVDNFLIQGD